MFSSQKQSDKNIFSLKDKWEIRGSLDCPGILEIPFQLSSIDKKIIAIPTRINCKLKILNLNIFIDNNKEEYTLIEESNFFETKKGYSKGIEYEKKENNESKIFSLILNFNEDNKIFLTLSNKESLNNKILYELVVSKSDGIKITSFPTNSNYAYFIIKNTNGW